MIKKTFYWGIAKSRRVTSDTMHMNSLYLMVSTGILAVIGFVFWIVAARAYTPSQIGLGGSLISLGGLLIAISGLGFSETLIRFLPTSKYPDKKISTALVVTGLAAISVAIIFWILSQFWFKQIHQLISTPLTFGIFSLALVAGIWQRIENSIFIARQKTQWIMLESAVYGGTKLALALPLVFLGGYGIFASNYLGLGIGMMIGMMVLLLYYKVNPFGGLHKSIIEEVGKYSLGSYVINILGILPAQLLPAIVTKQLGPQSAGFFFLTQMIVNLLLIIPQAGSQTLFAQAAKEKDDFNILALKSLKLQMILISIGTMSIWLFGGTILSAFGRGYLIEALQTLKILSLSALPLTLSFVFITKFRIEKKIRKLTLLSFLGMATILISSVTGGKFGLVGFALGYGIGQVLSLCIYVLFSGRE